MSLFSAQQSPSRSPTRSNHARHFHLPSPLLKSKIQQQPSARMGISTTATLLFLAAAQCLLSRHSTRGFAARQNVRARKSAYKTSPTLSGTRHFSFPPDEPGTLESRRNFGEKMVSALGLGALIAETGWVQPAQAAPPIAIIAEELGTPLDTSMLYIYNVPRDHLSHLFNVSTGYFPVTNSENETVYISKRIKRESTGT